MGRLIWQFAPALLVFGGAVLVALGGFWSSWRQSNFNTTLTEKNNEIAQLQLESANAIAGGNSFAYMVLQVPDPKSSSTVIPVFVIRGNTPSTTFKPALQTWTKRLTDQEDFNAATAALLGTTLQVGNLTPGFASTTRAVLPHPSGQNFSYNVFYVARNGAWINVVKVSRQVVIAAPGR
jgi:hypothetical protein